MFRTRATALTQDLTPRTAATHVTHGLSSDLRLRWTVRNSQLVARWEREPHDLTEGRAWSVGHVAA
jgi:hypothetical protein